MRPLWLVLAAVSALEVCGWAHLPLLKGAVSSTRVGSQAAVSAGGGGQGEAVLVSGATGGVGRLVVDALLQRGKRVKALVRDENKASLVFQSGDRDISEEVELVVGDLSDPTSLGEELFRDVAALICCSAATVRAKYSESSNESLRYFNGVPYFEPEVVGDPRQIDYEGVQALVGGMVQARPDLVESGDPQSCPRVVYVSSSGVTRPKDPTVDLGAEPPVVRMNDVLGGVLSWKFEAEHVIRESGLPYSIVRPCALVNGAPGDSVVVDQGDVLVGMIPRAAVADICVHALDCNAATGKTFEVRSSPSSLQGTASPSARVHGNAITRIDFRGLFEGLRLDVDLPTGPERTGS
uniref:NAD(P)-binding domain-containing protein n=1 Tax=Rhizochromulina marina TaxID=1034831 RepID=A0A7S2SQ64_9STRA|mmetsp:Transcript_4017/g.11774  ORF Transcript_4017/g.11774 Transcript_4017/m.11774 type:complete len:351 (+) Transcript_4017:80-1132(+)|eukprot:CAMPEP_0118982238 /NCGR_PEP_ID=MMETSP1173-20130426/32313_1 /TAXON_ID=1034831 /ORGANISM="Rhizochromulina marina cf, Strain CCMP1243" /LENGTH=350 /DNA_ID=CAMNT_0006932711 /DNA_START=18 /DNA_END=1070 /DNA_ORIENTATION=+